ncbi:MAG: hypothetical protein LBN23_07085 [Paludibacter sp.]|jgi:hypothetical protein|nr:hypothetical protein [Paludibacter sp.]
MKDINELPKHNNASSGKKAHNDNKFYKVGKIRYQNWAVKILKATDIVVFESELVHISKHHPEISRLGLTVFDFIKYVVKNFNRIYKGTKNSYILAVWHEHSAFSAAIELFVNENKEIYRINTAHPFDTNTLLKKKLLCANDH